MRLAVDNDLDRDGVPNYLDCDQDNDGDRNEEDNDDDNDGIVATVTDAEGAPLAGAKLDFIIDGESRGTAYARPNGQATITYNRPIGPSNEGGYDSIQVQVVTTDVVSRPIGVFWQPDESRRITISVSPDRLHTGAARTITAQVFDGASPLAGRAVELYIDGTIAGRATTNGEGVARFTRSAPVQGPFDLAKVALADDRDLASDTVLLSWPMGTRGVDSDNSWQLVWSDEFNGTSLDTAKWKANNNCPPVYLACDTDRQENVYVSDGMLHLRTLRERYAGTNNWTGSGNQFGPGGVSGSGAGPRTRTPSRRSGPRRSATGVVDACLRHVADGGGGSDSRATRA